MTYQIIITEESAANITIDNNTTNVSITTNEYPITIQYNAVIEQAGGNAYGNANVAAYLASSSLAGNIITSANISGAYILGNGSQLTGLPATYGNANVAANLAAFGSNPVSTTGNITAGYFAGNGSLLTNITAGNITGTVANATYALNSNAATFAGTVTTAAQPNITSVGILTAINTSGNVSATGNITGNYFLGNGSQLTGLPVQPGTYGNANVAANLAAFANNPISTSGNITSGNLNVGIDAVITGNLTVNGTTTTVNSNTVTINDKFINVANNAATAAQANGGGLGVGPVGGEYATLNYDSTANIWTTNIGLSVTGNVTGSVFTGNGSGLTALTGANVSGTVANATYALNANASTFAGTVTTNAQPNITSVGILTAVNTSGNISATGNITGSYFLGNGSQLTGVTATDAIHATTLRFPVKNTSGGTLAQNTPVYVTGSVGATGTLEVSASRADTAATMPCIGLLETALGVNAFGYAVAIGSLSSTNTSTYTIGQTLYVAPTGGLTQSRPTNANAVQSVGAAGRINASTGQIEVNIWNQADLPNLGLGNVWIGNAAAYPTQTVLATYTGNIGAGNLSVSGNVDAGNLRTAGVVTATGNINGANLVASANLTSTQQTIVGTANNGSTGNIVMSGKNIATDMAWLPDGGSAATAVNGRIVVGTGWNGNISHSARQNRLLVQDAFVRSNTTTNTQQFASDAIVSLTGNVTNNSFRVQAVGARVQIGGGSAANTINATFGVGSVGTIAALQPNIDVGNASPYNLGNTVVNQAVLNGGFFTINPGSTLTNAYGMIPGVNSNGAGANVTNYIGFASQLQGYGVGSVTGNVYGVYHGNNSSINTTGIGVANVVRSAPGYYAFYNADDVAQVQLGSLRSYNEFEFATATSGTVNINKLNAQVQFLNPTANVTIGDFQNFVSVANDGTNNDLQTDTVTLIVQQGATPYTVTMPTGNAAIKYAGGVSTIGATANSVTMVNITAMKSLGNALGSTLYLASVSSEFS